VCSVLACARCALLEGDEIDVHGAASIAHDIRDDVIEQFDIVALRAAAEKWLTEQTDSSNTD